MSEALRTMAGPWCGGVTESGATVKASVFPEAKQGRLLVFTNPGMNSGLVKFDHLYIENPDKNPNSKYEYKVAAFRAEGLQANTEYFYEIELDGRRGASLPGRFRTFPKTGTRANFKFALSSCANYSFWGGGEKTEAYRAIMHEPELLFFYHLGDLHYENIDKADVACRLEAYDKALRREHVADLFRKMPVIYCWDDHDFLGNNYGGSDPALVKAAQTARTAYDAYVPHYDFISAKDGIYQAFSVGRVLFLQTDTRSQKSRKNDPDTSAKTILGARQKKWLKDQLEFGKKEMDLTVWVNSFPWIGEPDSHSDYWAGYTKERRELAQFIKDKNVRNLCMISGDAHMLAIDNGSNSGYAKGAKGGFPVFHASALESPGSEKGGDYSLGTINKEPGKGIGDNRQYGTFEIRYENGIDSPRVRWQAKRAEKKTAKTSVLLEYVFDASNTYSEF